VWYNGGPGCSSLLGFIQEHGPCVFDQDATTISDNKWSWNKNANMIYIEAPAGVGFSQTNNPNDMRHNDMTTSQDNLKALTSFFQKFPEFVTNELYITGESYGGVYVPYVAW